MKYFFKTQYIVDTEIGEDLKLLISTYLNTKNSDEYYFGTLCVLHYKSFSSEENPEIYSVGAAIEMLILSLDIVDDLQDNDSEEIWMIKKSYSLNTVLFMLNRCISIILKTSFKYKYLALETLCKYLDICINGQQLDLQNEGKSEEVLLKIIEDKSGSLTAMSCLIGKILADGNFDENCFKYGIALGVIQQINNDINSLKNYNKKNDLLNGRFSLPIIYILHKYSIFTEYLIKSYISNGKLLVPYSNPLDIFNNCFAFQYSNLIKSKYRTSAKSYLDKVNLSFEAKNYILNYLH